MALLEAIKGLVIFLLCTIPTGLCMNSDCVLIEDSQLAILLDTNTTSNLTNTNIVCLSQGSQANTWTSLSLVANYTNRNLTQIQLTCLNGTWSIESNSSADADLSTELRNNCSMCTDPLSHPNISNPQHCLECPAKCSQGLGRCSAANECCSYFYNNTCAAQCPNNTLPNNISVCCPDGFQGDNCTIDIDECTDQPCQNGAQCTNTMGSYSCVCNAGYTGFNCEDDINECIVIMPCQNGLCTNTMGGYNCTCDTGYTGSNCDTDMDECSVDNPCVNNSTCENIPGSYQCSCVPGYTGFNCEIDINECVNDSCLNGGECIDGVNSFLCNCNLPWEGSRCDRCPGLLNNGQCEDILSSGAIAGIAIGLLAVVVIVAMVIAMIVAISYKLKGKKLTQQQRQKQLFSDKESSVHVFGNPMALESVADSGISIQSDDQLTVNPGALEFDEFESTQ